LMYDFVHYRLIKIAKNKPEINPIE